MKQIYLDKIAAAIVQKCTADEVYLLITALVDSPDAFYNMLQKAIERREVDSAL